MITADPQQRVTTLADHHRHPRPNDAAPDDRDLLLAFAPVVFAEMPDSIALRLPPDALAARIQEYFRFVARDDAAGLSALQGAARPARRGAQSRAKPKSRRGRRRRRAARDHDRRDAHARRAVHLREPEELLPEGRAARLLGDPSDLHGAAPVGARACGSAARRRTARASCSASSGSSGSRRKERLRRIEHQMLFGAEDGVPRRSRTSRRWRGRRARSGRGCAAAAARPGDAEAARAFLDWLLADNYVLIGMLRYTPGPDGVPQPRTDSALGVFTDPSLLPVVFPGLMEQEQAHMRPADDDDRIIDIDYCPNAHAIHHLEPIDDIVIREWTPDGKLAAATLLLGRLAKGALDRQAAGRAAAAARSSRGCSRTAAQPATRTPIARRARCSITSRAASCSTPTRRRSRRSIDRMVYMSGDNEIVVTTRQSTGYTPCSIAFSDLRYSHKAEEDLKQALGEAFGPISFNTWADMGAVALLVFYFDSETLEHPIDVEEVKDITRAHDHDVGGPGRGDPRSGVRPDRRPPPVPPLHPHRHAQRPVSRIDAARGSAGRSQALRTARSAARDERPARHRRIGDAEALFADDARPDRHAAHARRT